MSINPVPTTSSIDPIAAAEAAVRRNSTSEPHPQAASAAPDLGNKPKEEIRATQSPRTFAPVRRDEVRVQRDEEANGQIVIKYMDAAGNMILQIPSQQVLGLARAIEEALQEQAQEELRKSESVGPQPGPGGKS